MQVTVIENSIRHFRNAHIIFFFCSLKQCKRIVFSWDDCIFLGEIEILDQNFRGPTRCVTGNVKLAKKNMQETVLKRIKATCEIILGKRQTK